MAGQPAIPLASVGRPGRRAGQPALLCTALMESSSGQDNLPSPVLLLRGSGWGLARTTWPALIHPPTARLPGSNIGTKVPISARLNLSVIHTFGKGIQMDVGWLLGTAARGTFGPPGYAVRTPSLLWWREGTMFLPPTPPLLLPVSYYQ